MCCLTLSSPHDVLRMPVIPSSLAPHPPLYPRFRVPCLQRFCIHPRFPYARFFSLTTRSLPGLSSRHATIFLPKTCGIAQASSADATSPPRLKKPVVPRCAHCGRPLASCVSVWTTSLPGNPLPVHTINGPSFRMFPYFRARWCVS